MSLAENLEEYGSTRADFRDASDAERETVAFHLRIASAQANNSTGEDWESSAWERGVFRGHMEDKKNHYFYACGQAGIDRDEAEYIWWNYVYGGVAPVDRSKLV